MTDTDNRELAFFNLALEYHFSLNYISWNNIGFLSELLEPIPILYFLFFGIPIAYKRKIRQAK